MNVINLKLLAVKKNCFWFKKAISIQTYSLCIITSSNSALFNSVCNDAML